MRRIVSQQVSIGFAVAFQLRRFVTERREPTSGWNLVNIRGGEGEVEQKEKMAGQLLVTCGRGHTHPDAGLAERSARRLRTQGRERRQSNPLHRRPQSAGRAGAYERHCGVSHEGDGHVPAALALNVKHNGIVHKHAFS